MGFFGFWAFNTAGKTVTKVGIYALPPLGRSQKVTFFRKSAFFNNSRPNLSDDDGLIVHYSISPHTIFLKYIYVPNGKE
jgi:hypothetical protein